MPLHIHYQSAQGSYRTMYTRCAPPPTRRSSILRASGTGYCCCSWAATCGCGERIRQLGLQSHVSVTTGPRLHVGLFVFQGRLHGGDFGSSSNWRNGDIGFWARGTGVSSRWLWLMPPAHELTLFCQFPPSFSRKLIGLYKYLEQNSPQWVHNRYYLGKKIPTKGG